VFLLTGASIPSGTTAANSAGSYPSGPSRGHLDRRRDRQRLVVRRSGRLRWLRRQRSRSEPVKASSPCCVSRGRRTLIATDICSRSSSKRGCRIC